MSTKAPKTVRATTARQTLKTTRHPKPAVKRSATAQPQPRKRSAEAAPPASKQSQLIALLQTSTGATIEQMTRTTGWQPHTVRGTISGVLRKRLGLNVQCADAVDGGARVYRIVRAQA